MGNFFSNLWNDIVSVRRYRNGQFFFERYNTSPSYTQFLTYEQKLRIVFTNPAVLKVFKLNCDLFSMGMLKAVSDQGRERPNDRLLKMLQNPNPFQNRRQFMWDAMFYYMLGNAYLYSTRKVISNSTYLYWLNPAGLDFDTSTANDLSRIVMSPRTARELMDRTITYRQYNTQAIELRLGDIVPFHDLSNSVSKNWYQSYSPLDALYKVISNSDAALDSKNINVRFSGKYLVAGTKNANDVHALPMSPDEKEQIEANIQHPKSVTAVKTMTDIKRYVEDIGKLQLDEAYIKDFMHIGAMYSIPKEILDAVAEGSTFENQEKATGRHIEYAFKPKAADLMSGIEKRFGYTEGSTRLMYKFDHLMFMRIFEREAEAGRTTKLNNLIAAREAGLLSDEEFNAQGRALFEVDET